jgi:site-specific recombinase XerD
MEPADYLFRSRRNSGTYVSRRQDARLVDQWTEAIGLDSRMYGTHSLRRIKTSVIYNRTRNVRAVQLLLGHSKIESTIRYLGVEVDDALELVILTLSRRSSTVVAFVQEV